MPKQSYIPLGRQERQANFPGVEPLRKDDFSVMGIKLRAQLSLEQDSTANGERSVKCS